MILEMRKLVVFFLCLIIVSGCEKKNEDISSVKREIWNLETVYWESIKTGNINQFMELLHDKTSPWPETKKTPLSKEQTVEMIKQWVKYEKISTYELKPEIINVFGDLSIVFYSYQYKSNRGTVIGKITHTWVKQGQKWKMVGGMNSTFFSWPDSITQENETIGNPVPFSSRFMSVTKYKIIPIRSNAYIVDWESTGDYEGSKTSGPLDNSTEYCNGLITHLNGVRNGKGHCIYSTNDGDILIGEFKVINRKLKKGVLKRKIKFIAGTGKLAGIKGEGELRLIPVLTEEKNTMKYISEITYSYKAL